jgi:hypothetical protein
MTTKKQSKTTKTTKARGRKPLLIITQQTHGIYAGDPLAAAREEAEGLGYDVLVLPVGATAFVARG